MMNILLRRIAILLSLLLIAGAVSQASGGVDGTSVVSVATIKYPNGDSYVGNIDDNGLRNGKGIYEWVNGDVYEGDWLEDKAHGKGKFTYANGAVYDGDWLENKRHGKGKFTYANGNVYVGEYRNCLRNGKGKFTYANGDVYDGQYKDGLRNGLGTQTNWKVRRYQGQWSNDKMHGTGAMSWFGNLIEFKGEWKDGRLTSNYRVRVGIDVFALLNRPMLISSSHLENLLPLDRLVHAIYSHAVHYYFSFNHVLDLVWTIFWTIFWWEFLFRDLIGGKSNNEPTVGVGVIRVEREGTGDTDLVVRLNNDHSHCGICYEAFATDMETTDQTSQNLLPVMGPCGHYFCRGCIIARDHHAPNGATGCPMCNRADQFDPDNLVHHRMLIDLLQRGRPTGNAPEDEEA